MVAPTRRYAAGTTVPQERSRAELEGLLARYGADRFAYQWAGDNRVIGFRIDGRVIRIELKLPSAQDHNVLYSEGGKYRTVNQRREAQEQLTRERWRALILVTKAKLEAVASGISTIENEYLSQTILPDGRSVGEWVRPHVQTAYETGDAPLLLLAATAGG